MALVAVAVAEWLGPILIRAAHAGAIPGLGGLMEGRASRPVEGYLAAWEPIGRSAALAVTTLAVLAGGLVLFRRGLGAARSAPPSGAPSAQAGAILLLAAWTGILGGLAGAWYHLAWTYYRGGLVPPISDISQSAAWMTPLAYLASLGAVGLILAIAWRWLGRRMEVRTAAATLAGLATVSVMMETGWLHGAAAALLGLGLTVRLRAALSPGAGELEWVARRTLPLLLLAVLIAGLAVPALARLREHRQAMAAGPPTPGGPNVLFIVLDTERAASTSLHGAARPTTPFFDSLATHGAWFMRAIAPATWTLPSHAAMFTGRSPEELGVGWTQPLDGRHPTLAEVLGRQGYATAGFVANPHFLGDAWGLGRGFGVWQDQPTLPGVILRHSWISRKIMYRAAKALGYRQSLGRWTAEGVNAGFLAWLDRRQPARFLAFLNFYDPHHPYLPPTPYRQRFSPQHPPSLVSRESGDAADYTEAERAELLLAYETSIAYLDEQLGALFAALQTRGLLANTLVVVTSDHGEAFGEAGLMGHGRDPAMPVVHVPLVVVHPGRVSPGTVVTDPVGLTDLPATILDLAGADAAALPGRSLRPRLARDSSAFAGTAAFAYYGDVATVITRNHQFMRWRDGRKALFDHQVDPMLVNDLSTDPQRAPLLDSLSVQLLQRFPDWR